MKWYFLGACILAGLVILYLIYSYIFKVKKEEKKEAKKEAPKQVVIEEFESSKTFQGKKEGMVFKLGEKGLGYYLDRP